MSIPCNIEAEREVLGALLYDYQEVSVKFSKLVADDFYDETHRKIFNVMAEMLKLRLPITPITENTCLYPSGPPPPGERP